MQRHSGARWATLLAVTLVCWQVTGCGGGNDAGAPAATSSASQPASPPAAPSKSGASKDASRQSTAPQAAPETSVASKPAPDKAAPAATSESQRATEEAAPADQPVTVDDTPREPATVEEVVRLLDLRTLPLLEGAEVPAGRDQVGQLFYQVKAGTADLFKFHRDQFIERGWKQLQDGRDTGPNPGAAFTQNGFVVYLSVSEAPGPNNEAGWSRASISNHGNVSAAKLPVPEGAKLFYAFPIQTAYLTEAKVPETVEACRKLLCEQGWQPYGGNVIDANSQTLEFKKNAVHLMAWISVAPAQDGKTLISYNTDVLSADLPAPADAKDLRYFDNQKTLTFDYAPGKAEALAAFYREALAPKGWKSTSEPVDSGAGHAVVVFRNPQSDVITLGMMLRDDRTRVSVHHATGAELAALERQAAQPDEPEPAKPADAPKFTVPVPASAKGVEQEDPETLKITVAAGAGKATLEGLRKHFKAAGWKEEDASIQDQAGSVRFTKDDLQVLANFVDLGLGEDAEVSLVSFGIALAADRGAGAPAGSKPEAPAGNAQPAGGILAAQFPVPEGAAEVERDTESEMITYRSQLDLMKIAEFYRKELQKQGWKEDEGETFLEAKAGVGGITFAKGDVWVRIAIQDGKPASRTRMVVFGEGLVWPSAAKDAPEPAKADADAPDAPAAPAGNLVADDQYELPVPKDINETVQDRTPFRVAMNAKIAAELPRVLEFYRREMAARGWKEDAAKAAVADEQAVLVFTGKEGQGRLRLSRKRKDTLIEMELRYPDRAKKAGILPEPGKARLMLGNAHEKDVVFVVAGKEYKLAAGVGGKDPKDATSLQLAPGKYKVTIKIAGEDDQSEDMQLGADETWGLVVSPTGGYFPARLY